MTTLMPDSPGKKALSLVDPPILSACLDAIIPLVPPASRLAAFPAAPPSPILVGLNGLQGAGKTTLAAALAHVLRTRSALPTPVLVLSIDDFYLPRDAQRELADVRQPGNALVQLRGQPGTHDLPLLRQVLRRLGVLLGDGDDGEAADVTGAAGREDGVRIPRYDKAAHGGLGDRLHESRWDVVNAPGADPVRVIIIEGWCVGFRAVDSATLRARRENIGGTARSLLGAHPLSHLEFVNDSLRGYNFLCDALDVFVHLDAGSLAWVYDWRLQQERALRAEHGEAAGMTDERVVKFVDAYYPAYELYLDDLRTGEALRRNGKLTSHLRLVVDKDRTFQEKVAVA